MSCTGEYLTSCHFDKILFGKFEQVQTIRHFLVSRHCKRNVFRSVVNIKKNRNK
jgi:hypothetical protein